ncbi:MAG: glycosyltransferase [Hyphomicrobiaceae bacterium]
MAKVLMVGKYFPPTRGGIEEFTYGLAEVVGERHELTVLVHSEDRTSTVEQHEKYRVVRHATLVKAGPQPISPGMIGALAAERYDLIHLHVPNVFGVALVHALGRNSRLIVTHHADMVGFGAAGTVARSLYRRLLRHTDAVTVLSLKNRDLARDTAGIDVPFHALPMAIDPARFAPTPAVLSRIAALRAEHQDVDLLLSFVGRLVPYKGLDVLIDALPEAGNVRCLVVGEGRERPALEARAAALGVGDRIRFLGGVDETGKHAVLRASDAFVLPSTSTAEAFGIVQVEAQLCSLPILTTDLPSGVTDVTRANETGLVVPPGDSVALSAAIRRLRDDAALRRRLGDAGFERALANYSPDALRRSALALYDEVLAA